MLNLSQFATHFVDDAIDVHARPVREVVSTPQIDRVTQRWGEQLERVGTLQKYLMALCLIDYCGSNDDTYTMQDAIEFQDGDCLLGEQLTCELLLLAKESEECEAETNLLGLAYAVLEQLMLGSR